MIDEVIFFGGLIYLFTEFRSFKFSVWRGRQVSTLIVNLLRMINEGLFGNCLYLSYFVEDLENYCLRKCNKM